MRGWVTGARYLPVAVARDAGAGIARGGWALLGTCRWPWPELPGWALLGWGEWALLGTGRPALPRTVGWPLLGPAGCALPGAGGPALPGTGGWPLFATCRWALLGTGGWALVPTGGWALPDIYLRPLLTTHRSALPHSCMRTPTGRRLVPFRAVPHAAQPLGVTPSQSPGTMTLMRAPERLSLGRVIARGRPIPHGC
ncbi:hypothetical protein Ani05nite_41710 [Amorphoplanes nipponensis]|uniref:Uncharacterized protein n=1 Tax=Actinoplanes nipponensis TaxID=135950 RepID=A0A919JK62_9ACTN|nr:hypothetical protein Ani05nite_41710 [Actinoplanes nipponensis]